MLPTSSRPSRRKSGGFQPADPVGKRQFSAGRPSADAKFQGCESGFADADRTGPGSILSVAFKLACCDRPATGRLRLPLDCDATNMLQPLEQEAGPVSKGCSQAGQEDLPSRICGLVPLSADQRATEGRFPPDVTAPMLFLGYAAGLHSRRKLEATAWESLPKRHITNAFDSGRDGWRAVGVVCRSWRACRAMCRSWRACSVTAGRSRRTRAITKRSA